MDAGNNPVRYLPTNLLDGDPTTCWRVVGDGSGDTVTFTLPGVVRLTTLGLINGYAKTDPYSGADRYRQERRVTDVTWTFSDGTNVEQTLQDDDPSPQTIDVTSPPTSTLTMRINSTTSPGDPSYDYTAISEVTLVGSGQ